MLKQSGGFGCPVRVLRRVAEKNLDRLARGMKLKIPDTRVTRMEEWLNYLRILDVLATGAKQDKVARTVYAHMFSDSDTRDSRANFVRSRIHGARSYADSRYLHIALMDPKVFRTKVEENRQYLQGTRGRDHREQ